MNFKSVTFHPFKIIHRLGEPGKDGVVYSVEDWEGTTFAMKTFKKTKSVKNIKKEIELQILASKAGVAPVIYEYKDTYFVMDKLDEHLYDRIVKRKGIVTVKEQKQIIELFKKLDEIKVFHGDVNILNYMFKENKLYMIDFGMSKLIDAKLKTKLGTSTPNINLMTLGLVLKLKELHCNTKSWSYLSQFISSEHKKKFQITTS